MHTTLKCEPCLSNGMVISILIMINIKNNSLIIINIYMNEWPWWNYSTQLHNYTGL